MSTGCVRDLLPNGTTTAIRRLKVPMSTARPKACSSNMARQEQRYRKLNSKTENGRNSPGVQREKHGILHASGTQGQIQSERQTESQNYRGDKQQKDQD